eukprot:RCo004055
MGCTSCKKVPAVEEEARFVGPGPTITPALAGRDSPPVCTPRTSTVPLPGQVPVVERVILNPSPRSPLKQVSPVNVPSHQKSQSVSSPKENVNESAPLPEPKRPELPLPEAEPEPVHAEPQEEVHRARSAEDAAVELTERNDSPPEAAGCDERGTVRAPIFQAIETGDAEGLHAVLLREQPSPEQLQSEPYGSMMYFSARSGHVHVISTVFAWCGEGCLDWVEPVTGCQPLHVAAERGHHRAVAWLLAHHRQRSFDVWKLRNTLGDSPVDICVTKSSKHPECLRVMETFVEAEAAMGDKSSLRSSGIASFKVNPRNLAHSLSISTLFGDRNLGFSRELTSVEKLCGGVMQEGSVFLEGETAYTAWLKLRDQLVTERGSFWARHPTPEQVSYRLREAYESVDDEKLYDVALQLYTAESFLYRSVNAVLTNRHASSDAHIAPFVWLLHTATKRLAQRAPHTG